VSGDQFFWGALVTVALGITAAKAANDRNYYLAVLAGSIPIIGWLTFTLRTWGWLT